MQLPNDYKENRYLAEDFVFKYAKHIVDENLTINSVQFNYDESQELFNNLVNILLPNNNNIILSRVATRSSNYTLRDSVIWENWKSSHWNYNCYGYSINNFRRINPGDLSGKHFSISHSISKMADNTISDLQKLGFYAYKLSLMILFLLLPISEEIYFRIFVYEWLKSFNLYNVKFDHLFVLISAFVVALNHIQAFKNKIVFIQKFFVEGIFCSIIFLCFKNIWIMIVIHEVFNCMTFLSYYDLERKVENGN